MKGLFRFTIFLLFVLLLFLIPLRKSKHGEIVQPVEKEDSIKIIANYQKDSQIVITTNGIEKDTTWIVSTQLSKDTVVVSNATPVISQNNSPEKASEEIVIDWKSVLNTLLLFAFWFCFWGGVAFLIFNLLVNKWTKKYWLQYNENAPILDFTDGQLNYSNRNNVLEFKGLELDIVDTLPNSQKDTLANLPETTTKTVEKAPIDTSSIDPVSTDTNSDKSQQKTPVVSPNFFQKILHWFWGLWKSKEKDASTQATLVILDSNKNTNFNVLDVFKKAYEIVKLPFHIAKEALRGVLSIWRYIRTGTAGSVSIDFRWQDIIYVFFGITLVGFKNSRFYHTTIKALENTNVLDIFLIGIILVGVPTLLRKHWAWAVAAILIILTMLISMLATIVMEMEPSTEVAEPMDFRMLYIALGLIVAALVLWNLKKKISTISWPKIQLPQLKLPFGVKNTRKLLYFRFLLFGIFLIIFFFPYFQLGFFVAFELLGGWGTVFGRAILAYIFYEFFSYVVLSRLEDELLMEKYKDIVSKHKKNTATAAAKETPKKVVQDKNTYVDLKALMSQKKWWKNVDLEQFKEVVVSDEALDQNSEFIKLYLKNCVNVESLALDKNRLKKIPAQIFLLRNIEVLNLSHNQILAIPNNIKKLKNITTIYLAYNKISDIPDVLAELENLRYLDLTNNPLTEEAVQKLEKLLPHVTFHVDNKSKRADNRANIENQEEEVRDEDPNLVIKVSKLLRKELQTPEQTYYTSALIGQGLSDLPLSVLQQLPNLKGLALYGNAFSTIPKAVYHLPNLKNLSLPFNKIERIPDEIEQLVHLEELDLAGNKLSEISYNLFKLDNLKFINLTNTGLYHFPEELLQLKNLTKLHLANNNINYIPEQLTKLGKIEELVLDFIDIQSIPDVVFKMPNLKTLNWMGNGLRTIHKSFRNLQKLERLFLSYNVELVLSEKNLSALPKLTTLYITGLQLKQRQPNFNFAVFPKMKELGIGYNDYEAIPDSVFELEQLYSLSLTGNKISTIPAKIDLLTSLEYLYLDKNNIQTIPDNIKMLKKLRKIDFSGNPISDEEQERIRYLLPNVELVF